MRQFEEHRDDVDFYLWLQWLALQPVCRLLGDKPLCEMPIGLYRALVGSRRWGKPCDRELYCLKASAGAPPDILGPWGRTGDCRQWTRISSPRVPMNRLSSCCANMQNCGAHELIT